MGGLDVRVVEGADLEEILILKPCLYSLLTVVKRFTKAET